MISILPWTLRNRPKPWSVEPKPSSVELGKSRRHSLTAALFVSFLQQLDLGTCFPGEIKDLP